MAGLVPPAIPQPSDGLTKCTDRNGFAGSPSGCQLRPPSVVCSNERAPTTHPVVALMKSTPTNSSVEAYCFVQWFPSLVAKIACDPTAHPSREPTIWIADSAGTNSGSTPAGVADGLALAEGVLAEELVGLALAEADGDGCPAAVPPHPLTTSAITRGTTRVSHRPRAPLDTHIRRGRRSRHARREGSRPWDRSSACCNNAH